MAPGIIKRIIPLFFASGGAKADGTEGLDGASTTGWKMYVIMARRC